MHFICCGADGNPHREGGKKNVITAPLSSDGPNLPSIKGVILGINLFTGF